MSVRREPRSRASVSTGDAGEAPPETREETELKFIVPDLAAMRERLDVAGATCTGSAFEDNVVFDEPTGRLAARGELLCVRQERRSLVTFKAPRIGDPRFKVRDELEIEVSDAAAARALFVRLGFTRTRRYQKRRETWRLGEALVTIDELPFGTYCELEGTPEAIETAATALGLDLRDGLTSDYFALFDALCRAQGRPTGGDAVFPD